MYSRARVVVGRVLGFALLVGLAVQSPLRAQATPDAEFKKIGDAFSEAWAKGDAKAIAALHAKDAIRMSGGDEPAAKGTAAIEKAMMEAMSGPYKGTKLTITQEPATRVTADIYVGHGTYQITGGTPPAGTPTRGTYMNTMVRQGGRWLIAASAVMPSMMQK